jgi:hypothetical protein
LTQRLLLAGKLDFRFPGGNACLSGGARVLDGADARARIGAEVFASMNPREREARAQGEA